MKSSLILETVVVGLLETNCYIVGSSETKEVVIIDPGANAEKIKDVISRGGYKPQCVVNTHGHIDHIAADAEFSLPVYIHELDKGCFSDPDQNFSSFLNDHKTFRVDMRLLRDKDTVSIKSLTLEVIHTPGHTPGGICLKTDNIIFTGDTLFCEGVGRTDLPGGSYRDIVKSITKKILIFDDDVVIYPGHGPESTIGHERTNNPFVRLRPSSN